MKYMDSLLDQFLPVGTNIFQFIGDMSLLASILLLLHKILMSQSCRGISFKTQALYLTMYLTRYTDLFVVFISSYNTLMKIILIVTSGYILYLMRYKYRTTYDSANDSFKVEYLVASCLILGLIFNYKFSVLEILWSFSIFLESLAILPQISMLRRTGETGILPAHHLVALTVYRTFRTLSGIYKYFEYGFLDSIRTIAGIAQIGLYLVFFYIYFTRVDNQCEEMQSDEKENEEKMSEKRAQNQDQV